MGRFLDVPASSRRRGGAECETILVLVSIQVALSESFIDPGSVGERAGMPPVDTDSRLAYNNSIRKLTASRTVYVQVYTHHLYPQTLSLHLPDTFDQ